MTTRTPEVSSRKAQPPKPATKHDETPQHEPLPSHLPNLGGLTPEQVKLADAASEIIARGSRYGECAEAFVRALLIHDHAERFKISLQEFEKLPDQIGGYVDRTMRALARVWPEDIAIAVPKQDQESARLTVNNSLQRIDGKLQLVETKRDRSRRTITLPQVCLNALIVHQAKQEAERQWAADRWKETGFVFTTSVGTPIDGPACTHRFQKALKKAGLPHMRFHDLRHTCATLLLAQGVHPRLVMEILGHSQIAVTMNTYSHVIPAMQRDVANQMDAILTAPPPPVATPRVSRNVN